MDSVRSRVITRQIEIRNHGDFIYGAWMEGDLFILRRFPYAPEHFIQSGKIESAVWAGLLECQRYKMGHIDIGVEGGKLILT